MTRTRGASNGGEEAACLSLAVRDAPPQLMRVGGGERRRERSADSAPIDHSASRPLHLPWAGPQKRLDRFVRIHMGSNRNATLRSLGGAEAYPCVDSLDQLERTRERFAVQDRRTRLPDPASTPEERTWRKGGAGEQRGRTGVNRGRSWVVEEWKRKGGRSRRGQGSLPSAAATAFAWEPPRTDP